MFPRGRGWKIGERERVQRAGEIQGTHCSKITELEKATGTMKEYQDIDDPNKQTERFILPETLKLEVDSKSGQKIKFVSLLCH